MAKKFGNYSWAGFKWGRGWIPRKFKDDENHGPVYWDPALSSLSDGSWQTGVGGKDDLYYWGPIERIVNGEAGWYPQVEHGWYYWGSKGHYFFSDGGTIEHFSTAMTDNLHLSNQIRFSHLPKPGIPILCRQYYRESQASPLKVYREIEKVAYFVGNYFNQEELQTWDEDLQEIYWGNVNRTNPELMVIYNIDVTNSGVVTVSGLTNNDYIFDVGGDPVASGTWSALYYLGTTEGEENETYMLPYAPVESGTCHVFVYHSGLMPPTTSGTEYAVEMEWSAVPSGEMKCLVDHDLGVLYFGDGVTRGTIPTAGLSVGIYYRCPPMLEYEKVGTTDLITAIETEFQQLKKASPRNFLLLSEGLQDIDTLNLSADLPTMSPTYGPLVVGNAYATLRAEALDATAVPIENEEVTFYFNSVRSGANLGTSGASSSALTNSDGIAYTRLRSPSTVYELGEYISASGLVAQNKLFLTDIVPPSGVTEIFTYAVFANDDALGVTNPIERIETWITDAGAETPQGDQVTWERTRRAEANLAEPVPFDYSANTGRKKIIATYSSGIINPHTGQYGAWTPLQPSLVEYTSSGVYLTYPENLPEGNPVNSGLYGYFIVSPALVTLQAKAYNHRRNTWVYSNEIDVYLDISTEGKGTWYLDTVNAIPSGVVPGLPSHAVPSGIIPFGWRLPSVSPVFTAAAAISQVTFLTINSGIDYSLDWA